jgi:type IV secretory pathway VirB10-like protein
MDVVPELAEAGEAQVLVGDPARAVIDHEDESAGEQQQPDKPEKTADHAPPIPPRVPIVASPTGADAEIQPRQYFTGVLRGPFGP